MRTQGGKRPDRPLTVSQRLVRALEQRRTDLALAIETQETDLTGKREELADLVQFLDWLAGRVGRA